MVGITPDGESISPGWYTEPIPGEGDLWRVFATLWDRPTGVKEWEFSEVELALQDPIEENLTAGIRRVRGLWQNGAYYAVGDLVFQHANVEVQGTAFSGLAEYTSMRDHSAAPSNRPSGVGTDIWQLSRLPDSIADSAPSPPSGAEQTTAPPIEVNAVNVEYGKLIVESGVQTARPGEYAFGLGAGASYERVDGTWRKLKAATTIAVALRDRHGISRSVLWQKLAYACRHAIGQPERIKAIFSPSRWAQWVISEAQFSYNGNRAVLFGSSEKVRGSDDARLTGDQQVTFEVSMDYPENYEITNEAIAGLATGLSVDVSTSGRAVCSWSLPAGEIVRVIVGIRPVNVQEGLGRNVQLQGAATSHAFEDVEAGSYDLFVIPQNRAGATKPAASRRFTAT